MEHDATTEGCGVGWEHSVGWGAVRHEIGSTVGKTAAAEQRAHMQPHAMGQHGSGRYFEREME
jgi:hypothetical protein